MSENPRTDGSGPFGRRVKARALAFLFMAGSAVGALTLILPHPEGIEDARLWGLVGLAGILGGVVLARSESISERELHLAVAVATLILGVANYIVGTTVLYPILYGWAALYAFACFDLRPALMHMALIAASYVVVLVAQDAASPATRWVLAVGTPLVTGLLIANLLERLRGEARQAAARNSELQESEARTRAIVDAAPSAFATIEGDGTVLQWNREAERLVGIGADEALGRDVAELMFAPEDRAAHVQRRRGDFERPVGAPPSRREVQMVRRDGSRFPAEVIVSPVKTGERMLQSFFVHDLSDRDRLEAEREQLLRERAARQEAEQLAGVVRGLQVLLDTALAHTRLEPMLAALVPRVCEVVAAEAATVLLTDEAGQLVVRASTAMQEGEPPVEIAPGEGISGKVAQSGKPMILRDAQPGQVVDPATRNMRSVISVPLMAGGVVTGVIQVGVTAPDRFTEDDILLLRLAADRVALAIDHVRVYEREHRIAETLQRSLLPERLPSLPGLEVAARYQAAASEAEVGGDWYDVIPIDSSRVGLVMGDVAGKGLAAASMVGRLRSALRAYALEGHDVKTAVDRLNQLVWSDLEDSQMATLVFMVIDQAESTISWVNAGHLPPLVLEDGQPRFLDGPSSVPLGVMPYAQYEAGSIELPAGATILLYTDGLVERHGELIDHGLRRLAEAASDLPHSTERLCDELLEHLVPSGAAADDVAILALHAPPVGERFTLTLPAQPGELASMRALLRRWLGQADGTDEDVAEILIAAGEAATNAIEHGGNDAPFEVAGVIDGDEVDLTVTDRGSWREKSPERGGGRGLALIRELMDEVEVTRAADGTSVRMKRRLRNGAGVDPENGDATELQPGPGSG
jgi:PAS domain S-box-containing protein